MSLLRVLFVEDNRISSLINCALLRETGYDIIEACDAKEAMDVISRHEFLSALVTDIQLGPGADGFDVARHARAAYPNLPVVYISGTDQARVDVERVEHSEFVRKPFHPQRIMDALDRTLGAA